MNATRQAGLLARLWAFVKTPKFALLAIAFAGGIIFWGGFNTALEYTNREAFCISCHEMKENVFVEYRNTIHYQNRTGVRATCPDCQDRKSTRLNSSHSQQSRMPSSA